LQDFPKLPHSGRLIPAAYFVRLAVCADTAKREHIKTGALPVFHLHPRCPQIGGHRFQHLLDLAAFQSGVQVSASALA
jgi:hypothetical protein